MKQETGLASAWSLLKSTFEQWNNDNATHHAAALAFYTIFSLAPLLIIAVAIAGFFIGQSTIQEQIVRLVLRYVQNEDVSEFVRTILINFSAPQSSWVATLLSLGGLFFGATAVFTELRNTLNDIWDAPPRVDSGISRMILNRLLALVMVVGSGFTLVALVVLDTVFSHALDWVSLLPVDSPYLGMALSYLLFFSVTTLIIALIYKYIPDRSIAWSDVWIGAISTALLFAIGRQLIGVFLSYTTIATPYGAAGSLAILLIWTYFSAQIFFLGAEFTQVYTRTYGTRWVEHPMLAKDAGDAESEEETVHEPEPPRSKRLSRTRVTNSAKNLALAVGVIGVVSLASFLREPFRK